MSILLIGGAIIASGQSDYFRPPVGWAVLAVATGVLIAEMKHWVKIVPAIFVYGILVALHQLQTGYISGHPEIRVSRLVGLWAVLLYLTIAAVSATIALRELILLDRVALLTFVGFFLWGYVAPSSVNGLIKMSIGLGCLLVAWGYNSLKGRSERRGAPRMTRSRGTT